MHTEYNVNYINETQLKHVLSEKEANQCEGPIQGRRRQLKSSTAKLCLRTNFFWGGGSRGKLPRNCL